MSKPAFDVGGLTGAEIDALREAFVRRDREREADEYAKRQAAEQEYRRELLARAAHPWFSAPTWDYSNGPSHVARASKAARDRSWREPPTVSDWQRSIELRAEGRHVHLTCRIEPFIKEATADEAVGKFAAHLRELAADMVKTADAMEAAGKRHNE